MLLLIGGLMGISLLVISSTTCLGGDLNVDEAFLTPFVKNQLFWFGMGWVLYFCFAALDYRVFKRWAWWLYAFVLCALLGLFFAPAVHNCHRWYPLPGTGILLQPSELAKLAVIALLGLFLESHSHEMQRRSVAAKALGIVLVPFVLILKQPDLGTALVFYPIVLVLFYLAGMRRSIVRMMVGFKIAGLIVASLFFLDILPHEELKPYMTRFLKEYQYERLSADSYHQRAAQTAIALGGWSGTGWRQSEFTGHKWLPAAHTDSVFAAFSEEFGLLGVFLLLLFFFALIYRTFQVAMRAKDPFGRLLAAGIATNLAMHMLVNMGMMCGFLPITGIPLLLISYGGSSVLSTMMSLGVLQSIKSRRFVF